MSMADVFEWPKELRFGLIRESEEYDLTCQFCGRLKCDMSYSFYFEGERRTVGVHAKCVKLVRPVKGVYP